MHPSVWPCGTLSGEVFWWVTTTSPLGSDADKKVEKLHNSMLDCFCDEASMWLRNRLSGDSNLVEGEVDGTEYESPWVSGHTFM